SSSSAGSPRIWAPTARPRLSCRPGRPELLARPGDYRRLSPPVDHDRAPVGDHHDAVLVEAGGLHGHDAHVGPGAGLALVQHLRTGVDRVAFEDRMRQPDLVP